MLVAVPSGSVEAAAPTGMGAPSLEVGNTRLTVTWAAPTYNGGSSINDYDVQYSVSNSNSWVEWSPGINPTRSATITGLINGQSYEVQVRAHNSGGSLSSWSTSARAMPAGVPATPLAPTLTPGNEELTVTWAAPANNGALITEYTVRYKLATATWGSGSFTRTTVNPTMTIAGLTNLKSYDVQVYATNPAGDSNWSPSAQAMPGLTPSKPGAPTLFSTGPITLAVRWDAPADNGAAIDNYEVRYRPVTDPVSDWVKRPTAVSTFKIVIITGLTNKQTYEIQVQAHNLVGWSAWSDSLSATTAGVPDAPVAPTLTVSDLGLLVSWVAPADNGAAITDYDVRYRLTSTSPNGAWTDANYDGTGTSTTITGLTNGVRYDVQVRAINIVLEGDWSPSATLTATPAKPLAPTLAPGNEKIRVSWVAPDDNGAAITDYDVRYKETSVSGWTDAIQGLITDGTGASMTIDVLINGTSYDVQVRAFNSVGWSDWSPSASATPTDQKPATPSGIRAGVTPPGDGFGYFDWNDPSDPSIIKYQYRKKEQGGAWTDWAEMPGSGATTTSYKFTGLTNFVNNYIDIRAVNLNGESPGSSNLGSASVFPRHPLPAPTGLTATAGNQEVELSWSMPSGAWDSSVTAYEYRQKEGSADWRDDNWTQGSSSRSTTTHTVINLANGTTYYFQVRAMSLNIPGLSSGEASATPAPAAAPATPQAPTLIPGNTQLTVKWVAPAANGAAIDDYDVRYRLTSPSGAWTDANHIGTGTSKTITSLTNSTSYDVQVRAHNSVNWSSWSSSASAAPTDQKPAAPVIQGTSSYKGRGTGDGFITIIWANPSDPSITGYQYQQREQGDDWPTPTVWTNMVPSDATTQGFTFEGLTPFVIYDFRIRAVNHNGESEPSNVLYEAKALGTMPAPTNLMAIPGGGEVQLRWTMPSGAWDGEIGFYEYRKKEGSGIWGAWTKSSVAGSLSTTHVVSGLTNGVTYYFEVRAGTYATSGEASNVASAVPVGVPSRPGAPTLVVGNQQLDVSWNEPADNGTSISDYDVQYKETSDSDWIEWNPGTSTTRSETITGLINDTGYQVRVRATSSAGSSLWSDTADATPEAQKPAAPAAPTLTPGNMQLTVTWVAPADNGAAISDYDVQYRLTSASASDPWTDANHTGTGTSTTITGLTNGTSYDVQVLAFNSAGFGPWSLSASATPVPAAAPATPQAPTLAPYDGEIRVTWAAPADNGAAIDDYDVQYRLTSASDPDPWTDANHTGTGTSTTITSLINGTSYDVQVRAHNSVDWSGWSLSASATPGVRPAAPSSLATQDSGDGFVDLTWNAPGDASITGYQYQYKTTSGAWGASWTNIQGSDSTTTEFIVRGLTNFVEYDLRIRAVNAVGAGPASQGYGQPVGQLPAPTGLTATAGHQAVELSWSMPSGTWDPYVTSYQYQRKEASVLVWGDDWTESSSKLNKLSTTHIVTGLTNGTAYDFRVRAMLFSIPGLASNKASATPVAVPSRPEVPTLAANDQQLAVSWVEPADNGTSISDYDVQYKETSVILWTDASYTGTGTDTTITGLTNGTSYDVRVRAASSVGSSLWSDAASATPGVRPAQPSGFGIHGGGDGFVILGWENPGDSSITGYQYRKESTGEWGAWTNIPGSSTMTEFTVMGLTNFVEYRLRVRAVNGIGAGPATAVFTGRPAGALPAPTNLTATPGNQEVELSWTMSSGAWDDYIVYYDYQMKEATASDWGDDWTESSNIGGTGLSTTHVVTGLTNGVTYDFRVRARGFTGPGQESNKASATPVAPVATTPDAPGVPTLVVGNRQLGVSWDAPADNGAAITDYDVQYRPVTDPVSSWTEWNAGDTSVTIGVTITNLDNGTSYDVQVRATNSAGYGPWSDAARASPSESAAQAPSTTRPGAPAAPTLVPGNGQLAVSWNAPADDGGSPILFYRVYVYTDADELWKHHFRVDPSITSTLITGLTNGQSYRVAVRAENVKGPGSISARSDSATPLATLAAIWVKPSVPTGLSAAAEDGAVALSWTASAQGSDTVGYDLQYRSGDGSWTFVPSGRISGTSHTISGLANGMEYEFQVRASNLYPSGLWFMSAWTASVTAMPEAASPGGVPAAPAAPLAPTLIPGNAQLSVEWARPDANFDTITGYDVRYKRSSDSAWSDHSHTGAGRNTVIDGLTNGQSYEVQVRAKNSVGSSGWSASARAAPGSPEAPDGFAITGSGDGFVILTWDDPSDASITGYQYQKRSTFEWGASWTRIPGSSATTTELTVTGLANFVTYYFRIRAVNAVGPGPVSRTIPREAVGILPAPTGLTATPGNQEVELNWSMPSGAWVHHIASYEYQMKEATASVWGAWTESSNIVGGVGGLSTMHIVTGLTNGVTYDFKVRARSLSVSAPPGLESIPASATLPADWIAPSVPTELSAVAGNGAATLSWSASTQGSGTVGYDLQYRSGDGDWIIVRSGRISGTSHTIDVGLSNGMEYEFQARASNLDPSGVWHMSAWTASVTATPAAAPAVPLAPTLTPGDSELAVAWDAPAANGAAISDYDVRYKRSSDSAWSDHAHTGAGTETTISGLTNGQLYEVQVRANNRVGGSDWSPSARATPAAAPVAPLTPTLTPGDSELAVAWAAPAANGAAISDYDVRYKRSSDSAWSDHAHTGAGTETTISGLTNGQLYEVQVRANNRVGGSDWSPSARATPLAGWIAALVPMELAYFGRTVTSQVVDVVEARLAAPRSPGRQVTLAGHALPSWDGEAVNSGSGAASRDAEEALRDWLVQAGANESGWYDNGYGGERGVESRALSEREMVAGTSFALTRGTAGGADFASVWGRGSTKHFEGQADGLTLDGEVTTGFIGADWASARWRAGLAVGYSNGTGEYRGADGSGQVETTLTGVYPYTGIKLSDRLSVWATAGHGAGDLTLKSGDGEEIETDLSMSLVAAGMRSEIHRPEGDSGLAFAVKADTRFARTSAEAAQGDSGHLAAAVAEVWQARAGLEGSRRFAFGEVGTVLTPSFEVGLRFDGGDAGRGFGVDLGGGLAFANPQRGLKLDLNARSLVAHEARDLREWGASVGLSFDPRPSTERGLEWSFGQSWGASALGGMEALFGRETLAGLVANDPAAGSRLEGEIGYGLPVFGGGFTGTPYTGFGLSSDGARDYAVGWRLTLARPGDSGFEVGLEATRREAANDGGAPEHGAMLRAKIRW